MNASWELPSNALADLRLSRARSEMEAFVRRTWPHYQWNWHHKAICTYLDALTERRIRRLMILAPPRHGKSELASRRFPAYYLGRRPDDEVINLSYAASLATAMNRDVQRIIDGPNYHRIFPGTRLFGRGGSKADRFLSRAKRTESLFEVVGRNGRLRSAGIRGGITGTGFHLGIADDLYKNAEEALSLTVRQKVEQEFKSSFMTRQYPDAAVLLIGTPWHHDDIYTTLVRENPGEWEVLSLPALSEGLRHRADKRHRDGMALWPERFNEAWLEKIKAEVGSLWWNALYRLKPMPAGGNYFNRNAFGRYTDGGTHWHITGRHQPVPKAECTIVSAVDPAASENTAADYTAIVTGALTPLNDLLILEVEKFRVTPDKIPKRMIESGRRHAPMFWVFESNGFQIAIVSAARRERELAPIREVEPRGRGKVVRATPAMVKVEAGQVFVPDGSPDWLGPWFDVLERFRGEDEENDVVDAFADLVRQCPRLTMERSTPDEDQVLERLSLRDRESNAQRRGMLGRR